MVKSYSFRRHSVPKPAFQGSARETEVHLPVGRMGGFPSGDNLRSHGHLTRAHRSRQRHATLIRSIVIIVTLEMPVRVPGLVCVLVRVHIRVLFDNVRCVVAYRQGGVPFWLHPVRSPLAAATRAVAAAKARPVMHTTTSLSLLFIGRLLQVFSREQSPRSLYSSIHAGILC